MNTDCLLESFARAAGCSPTLPYDRALDKLPVIRRRDVKGVRFLLTSSVEMVS
jgi:hypothetical protein